MEFLCDFEIILMNITRDFENFILTDSLFQRNIPLLYGMNFHCEQLSE